ncbi:DNA-binding domain-containing protein [Novosphingobium sp.]|uniref:HvfC/BufC N-terminal domain-containing protein n=1 Tax=Novosphingobium sp. TaxID=1874826 RepID=UPI0025EAF824|nr:DNA-binding domain-containing protein [Novosphingobium sp.]
MSLAALQKTFLDAVSADDDAPAVSLGMAVYRDAYRTRLLGALESSFERTRRWTGDAAFAAAACHYILTRPPSSWTLDEYGADFSAALETLFAGDCEVAELAWIEWHMQRAFAARDSATLDAARLASAGLEGSDWDRLQFVPAAGFALRRLGTGAPALWTALADTGAAEPVLGEPEENHIIVWRRGLVPQLRVICAGEYAALNLISAGGTLGELASRPDSAELGSWLALWLVHGLFADFALASDQPATALL